MPKWIQAEIVAFYGGLNTFLGALVALGVPLTEKQTGALFALLNVVLAPIVRAFVTPTVKVDQ